MPQIKIRGAETEKILEVSRPMTDSLQQLLECPRNYITIECIHSTFIMDDKISSGFPFVEVAWFDRGQELQDQTAKLITGYMSQAGYANVDIMFNPLEKSRYYENGVHF